MKTSLIAALMTTAEVARLLNKKESWVRSARRRHLLAFVKVGQAVRYKHADVVAFIEAQRVPAETAAEGR